MRKNKHPGNTIPVSSSLAIPLLHKFVVLVYILVLLVANNHIVAQVTETGKDKHEPTRREKKLRDGKKQSDSLYYEHKKESFSKTEKFYEKLEDGKNRSKFLNSIHPLIFQSASSNETDGQELSNELPHDEYDGRIIRSIKIKRLDVFGTSVHDTTLYTKTRVGKALNKSHVNTHTGIIRKYLLIKEGEPLNAKTLADNERILREVSIFEDAWFYLSEVAGSDSIDIVLAIKDIFPVGGDITVKGLSNSKIRLFNKNLLGSGSQLEQSMEYNTKAAPYFYLTKGAYTIRNIFGEFADIRNYWMVGPDARGIGVQGLKPFLTPETRFGGGAKIEKLWKNIIESSEGGNENLHYLHYDVWAGYAPLIKRLSNLSTPIRLQAYVLGRINTMHHYNHMALNDSLFPNQYSFSRKLISVGLLWSGSVRRNMILGFGRTEDIPVGALIETTFGRSDSDRETGLYTGFKGNRGVNLPSGAHIFAELETGGYWNKGQFTDGAVNLNIKIISKLFQANYSRIRVYGVINYTRGINRVSPQMFNIKPWQFPSIYQHFDQEGHDRLNIKSETVIFTPIYLLGFRCAFYAVGELALITDKPGRLLNASPIPAFEIGIKVRNEHLVFSTFKLGLTFFPVANDKNQHFFFSISDQTTTGLKLLKIQEPDFIEYR